MGRAQLLYSRRAAGLCAKIGVTNMTSIVNFPITDWRLQCSIATQEQARRMLEDGNVLFFPNLTFLIEPAEQRFLSLDVVGKSKNVSLDLATGRLRGSRVVEAEAILLQGMIERFAVYARDLMNNLLPHYRQNLMQARTSFRPVEVAGRVTSWRKDDTRLHVDSFPSMPVQGKRILRVFSNVNADGQCRCWRLGEPFENIASRYLPKLAKPAWGSSQVLQLCGITKSRRSVYDHFMLQLHDRMKADSDYQANSEQIYFEFPANSTWIAFTDQVSHAAMSGQHLLEQTFYLPVDAMREPALAPLRILERLSGRKLA